MGRDKTVSPSENDKWTNAVPSYCSCSDPQARLGNPTTRVQTPSRRRACTRSISSARGPRRASEPGSLRVAETGVELDPTSTRRASKTARTEEGKAGRDPRPGGWASTPGRNTRDRGSGRRRTGGSSTFRGRRIGPRDRRTGRRRRSRTRTSGGNWRGRRRGRRNAPGSYKNI